MGRRLRVTDTTSSTPTPAPVTRTRPDPAAWRVAVHFVDQDGDGDLRRIEVTGDDVGSVIVHNRPIRSRR